MSVDWTTDASFEPISKEDQEKSRKKWYIGCSNLLSINKSPIFNGIKLVTFAVAYYVVTLEFTAVASRTTNMRISTNSEGIVNVFVYCSDYMTLLDISLAMLRKKANLKSRHPLSIFVEFVAFIPYEFIYVVLLGTNRKIFYALRLRFLLKFLRFNVTFNKLFAVKYSIACVVSKLATLTGLLCITLSCARISLKCNYDPDPDLKCDNITTADYTILYFVTNGQITNADLLLTGLSYIRLEYYCGVFQLAFFIYVYVISSQLICIYIETLLKKYDFAIKNSVALCFLRMAKARTGKWSLDDEAFVTQLNYYVDSLWQYKSNQHIKNIELGGYAIATIPSIFKIELSLDMSWNLFKHSKLFKDEETHVLRYLSQFVEFKRFLNGDIINKKGKFKQRMVYILSGIVDVLSEDNLESSIVSLTGGSCIGEFCLFMGYPSSTTIVCKTYCDLLLLSHKNFIGMKKIYPIQYASLKKQALSRIGVAKNYDIIAKYFQETGVIETCKSELSLKYIKTSLRTYIGDLDVNEGEDLLALDEAKVEFKFNLSVFCTDYLSEYVLAKKLTKTLKVNVMAGGIFFKLNPHSSILEIWNVLLYSLSLATCLIFPIGGSLKQEEYIKIYDFYMTFVSLLYILDFASFIFIAVESKDTVLLKFEDVLHHKMKQSYFWVDLFSSVPIALIINVLNGPLPRNNYQLCEFNKLLKVYKVLSYLQDKQFSSPKKLLVVTLVKVWTSLFVIGFIGYFIFNLFHYYDGCKIVPTNKYYVFTLKLSVVFQFFLSTALGPLTVNKNLNFIPLILLQYVVFIWKMRIIPKLMASFSLYSKQITQYENIVEDVRRLLVLNSLTSNRKIVDDYLRINYKMDRGLYMNKLILLKSFIGNSLYSIQNSIINRDYFQMDPFFKDLPQLLVRQINEISKYILIPRGSVVCFAGSFPNDMYVIVKGTCAYVHGKKITKFLGIGNAFLVLEALHCVPIVHNVLAVTDCKLIMIPRKRFIRKFLKFPVHYEILSRCLMDTVRYDFLKNMERSPAKIEVVMLNTGTHSFKKFSSKFVEYIRGFGKMSPLRLFFMKFSITPYGRFWLYWEIFRNVIAFLSAFMGSIPITTYNNYKSGWFWMFRIFDLVASVDIYLKHHLVYYNINRVEVTHPWKTCLHYWKSSFIVDVLGCLPIDLYCMAIKDFSSKKIILLICPRLNRYLPLYRSIGLRRYVIESNLSEMRILLIVYYALCMILFCSLMVPMFIFLECTLDYVKSDMICEDGRFPFWETYFVYTKMLMKNVFTIGIFDGEYSDAYVWKVCLVSIWGFILITYISCSFTGLSLFKLSYLTTYQIKMQRLVYFMGMCKIDKRLWDEMIKYYEYIWILKEGKRFRATFQQFNKTLCDELLYTKYGPTLSKTILFRGCPRVVLKELLHNPNVRFSTYLIRGIVLRVNDIQKNIFILNQGVVDVLDPGYDFLEQLDEGSIFGCLDDVSMHRSTLTYVAKTHCEFVVLPIHSFYQVIKGHPDVFRHYKYLMRQTNMDYIKNAGRRESTLAQMRRITIMDKITVKFKSRVRHIFKVYKPKETSVKVFVILSFISFKLEAFQKVLLIHHTSLICILYIFDVIYWVKIYMCFSTAYENAYGLLVTRRKLIALRYIRNFSEFAVDLMSNFPLEIIALLFLDRPIFWTIWSYLRINRLLKIVSVFKYVRSIRNRLHVNVFFVRGLYILLIVITMQQLGMIVIVQNPMIQRNSNLLYMYFMTFSIQSYLMSGATFVPFGISPSVVRKEIYYNLTSLILMMASQLMIIYVFAECASTYQVLKYGDLRYESYLQLLESDMKNKGISKPLEARVIKYFRNLVNTGRHVQMPQFIREAPFYLKQGVLDSMFGFHLRTHPVFRNCHLDLLRQMAATFETLYFFKDDYIAFVGDIDGQMYFIHEGEVVGLSEDNLLHDTASVRLTVGDYFGLYQLISNNIGHFFSYKVVTNSTILMLRKECVSPLIKMFPASKHLIYSTLGSKTTCNAESAYFVLHRDSQIL